MTGRDAEPPPPGRPCPGIIAHRGASAFARENTLEAFELAWSQGADAIETDLRRTADGDTVCFHDADGRRLLGRRERIAALTRAELDPIVPSLPEVLAQVPPGRSVVLELKEPLAVTLGAFDPARVTFLAFDPATIAAAKRAHPASRALWLVGESLRTLAAPALIARVHDLGIDGVDLRYSRQLTPALLAPVQSAGLTVFTYTVNHAHGVRRCARLGLDGITTDRPGDARRWLG